MFEVIAIAAKLSGLEKWGAIFAIVAGVIAAILFSGGVLRWLWLRVRQPNLIVMCGNARDFNRRLATSTPDIQMTAADVGLTVLAVHAKLLKVRETKGTIARQVAARVTAVDPIGEREHFLPVSLEWTTGVETTDIQPYGQKELVLQRIVVGRAGETYTFVVGPTVFENSPLEFTLEVLIDGKTHNELRFRLENPWPGLYLLAGPSDEPPPDPFPYPKIKPVVW